MRISSIALALCLPALVTPTILAQDAPSRPEVGQASPKVRVNDHLGKAVAIGGETETWTVLAFYPKAFTGG